MKAKVVAWMRPKMAPNLSQMVEDAEKLGLGYYPSKCRAELRALLAVYRAARRIVEETYPVTGRPGKNAWMTPLDRALARVERLSGRGK
jgi:hypothetical protein